MKHWAGRFVVGDGYGCYAGPTFAAARHAHHAVQLIFAVDGRVRVRVGDDGAWRHVRDAVVPPDVAHDYDGGGSAAVLVYLDPERPEGRTVGAAVGGTAGRLSTALRRELRPAIDAVARAAAVADDGDAFAASVADAVTTIGRGAGGRAAALRPDPRVVVALEHLRRARGARVSLATLARAASLSPSRLACLFRAETGLPVRRYALWLRLQHATSHLAADPRARLSAAAHAAGFADAAHMTRTFRRMLGVAPSAVARPAPPAAV